MILSAVFSRGRENVNFLTHMRTKCVLRYQISTPCVPNVNFADLFGSTGLGYGCTGTRLARRAGKTGTRGPGPCRGTGSWHSYSYGKFIWVFCVLSILVGCRGGGVIFISLLFYMFQIILNIFFLFFGVFLVDKN